MTTINIYLTFDGNCEEAFDYYLSIFGGEFSFKGRFSDMPPQEGQAFSEDDGNRIMHISLPIGGDTVLMGSDTGGEWSAKLTPGNNFSISIAAESKEDADRFFEALSAGGNVTMPMSQTFWGDYFGSCEDKFGINWMIGFNENPPS